MGLKLYNTPRQRLNGLELMMMNKFNTYDFAGFYKDINGSIINIDADDMSWTWTEGVLPSRLIGGGCMLEYSEDDTSYKFEGNNNLCVFKVNLDSDKNISTETLGAPNGITFISCSKIERVAYNNEFQEESGDSYLDAETKEADAYMYTFTIDGEDYKYWCNSIWLNDHTFLIPICCLLDDSIIQLVTSKNKASLEDFLSRELYNKLIDYVNSTFVWHEAGSDTAGGVEKGKVGNLLISDSQIKGYTPDTSEESPTDIVDIASAHIYMSGIAEHDDSQGQERKVLVLDDNEVHKIETLDVANGGTGGTTKAEARNGIGIYYGTAAPNDLGAPPIDNPQEGDIYFYIPSI